MQNDYDFGMKWNDRLVKARNEAGVTDTDIARHLKVSNPTVYGWMTGKTKNIESRHLLPLCVFLNVSPHWIMFGDSKEFSFEQPVKRIAVDAVDAVRLFTLFAQTDDEGRHKLLETAEETQRLFPRG